jgi:hypothetical protein
MRTCASAMRRFLRRRTVGGCRRRRGARERPRTRQVQVERQRPGAALGDQRTRHRHLASADPVTRTGSFQFVVRAYDAKTGAFLWQQRLDRGTTRDVAERLAADKGRVFVVGHTRGPTGSTGLHPGGVRRGNGRRTVGGRHQRTALRHRGVGDRRSRCGVRGGHGQKRRERSRPRGAPAHRIPDRRAPGAEK